VLALTLETRMLEKDRHEKLYRKCDSCGGIQYSVHDKPPMGMPEGCESLGFIHLAHVQCVVRCRTCFAQYCRTCIPPDQELCSVCLKLVPNLQTPSK
jgi:hypothetical protein